MISASTEHQYTRTVFYLFFIISVFLIAPPCFAGESGHQHPWGYEGGVDPSHWGELEDDHEKHLMCREGVRQSPINIDDVPGLRLADLGCRFHKTPMRIINNGHTILVRYSPGSFAQWGNEKFELIQFHFHHHSEHLIKGKPYPLEIHLVHKTPYHQYVVVGILAKTGKHNPAIQKIWDKIPTELDKEVTYKDIFVSAGDLLPSSKEYFHYTGSLTTPPCTENVSWFILEEPIEISKEQIEQFKKYIHFNARPVQKLNHRIVVKIK